MGPADSPLCPEGWTESSSSCGFKQWCAFNGIGRILPISQMKKLSNGPYLTVLQGGPDETVRVNAEPDARNTVSVQSSAGIFVQ